MKLAMVQYMNSIWSIYGFGVLRVNEGTEEEEEEEEEVSKRTCMWLLLSALTSNNYKSTLTYCQTSEKPILSKEQRFVALRQQGSLQSHF